MDEHKVGVKDLFKKLDSDEKGLSTKEAEKRLNEYGLNVLESKKSLSPIFRFLKQFANFFALLLLFGSGLSFFAEYISPGQGNIYIAIALLVVVFLNAIFTFIQEYQSERIMDSFRSMLPNIVEVLRDGKKIQIEGKFIVPGDIVYLAEGDKIPADGRLISHNAMKIDLSSITGESEPELRKLECTSKNILESRNMIFSGTSVQSGNGAALVYGTGMNTEIGKIVKLTKESKEVETPLRKELKHFISIISTIAITLGVVFFIVSLLLGHPQVPSLIFAIGIIVANVPEGLLPTVTLSLSITAKRMAKKNALIKNLESVETLGSTSVICTDKTGTLTQNKMEVSTIYMNGEEVGSYEKGIEKKKGLNVLLKTMTYCNNARFENNKAIGDPTETSLINFSKRFVDLKVFNEQRAHETPFDSETKRMIVTTKVKGGLVAYLKGAPEVVMGKCNRLMQNGEIKKLNTKTRKEISDFYKKMASRGERVLGLAYKKTDTPKAKEEEFIFLGLIGMMDPPRPEVSDALDKCKTAGIKVIMVTGDYGLTAEAIGKKIGLISERAHIMTGDKLEKTSDSELKDFLKNEEIIFARTAPAQKMRIVQTLQSMGEVVSVTGDGVNDAPALKNADMGVAMGISGTEVAREAADMVLMDDNFATIVSAVEEGRTIFDNIKKFVAYILTSNIPEIFPFIAFVLLGIPLPLTVVLILAIDLGTDIVPALGLGTEKPESDVMLKKPRKRSERLLTKNLLFMSYGIVGVIQAAAGFFAYFVVLFRGGWTWGQQLAFNDPLYITATTAFFGSIVICQVADVLICRTRRRSIFEGGVNKLVLVGIATELLLLAFISYSPIMNRILSTGPLTLFELSLSIPFALLIFFGDELRKVFVRNENKFVKKYLTW